MDIGAGDGATMTALAGLVMLIGLAGVVVPFLPGLPLVWGGVLLWALVRHDAVAWAALVVASILLVAGIAAKYALPGRRLREAGVPVGALLLGGALGVVGFFVVPVVGAVLGFVLGVYVAERVRLGGSGAAWPATRSTLAAVGWSIAIELTAGLLIVVVWVVALLASR
jgi:uncharacterized protein YqgC (DUF456 family)